MQDKLKNGIWGRTLTPTDDGRRWWLQGTSHRRCGEALLRHFDSEQEVPLLFSVRKVREPYFWFWTTSVLLPEEQDPLLRPLLAEEPSWHSTSCNNSSKYQ
jgi:hypothetical protein